MTKRSSEGKTKNMSYAYWRKCDFQVHTPRDPNWQGSRPVGIGEDKGGTPATAPDVDTERRQWADDFIEQCIRRSLEAIAITDHHEMIMVPYIQEAIAARKQHNPEFDLWLFPGMELTCRGGVQCLIIFDSNLTEEWRNAAQSKLGIVVAALNDKARQAPRVTQLDCSYPEIAKRLETVEQLKGRYIVLPNVSQGGQYTVLTNGSHADFCIMPYVGGYLDNGQTIHTINNTNKRRLSGEEPIWGTRFIYPLPTSDARSADYSQLGNNSCWIKLATPTAEAIRQAFLAHQSRISISRPSISALTIKSILVSGSAILADGELVLSPELNSFIGGRGSGKSTMLEYIAFGLGKSCYDLERPEYSGSERLAGVIKDTLIAPGSTVELAISQDGATFNIRRSGADSYSPKVTYPDGTSQELSLNELRSLFPVTVYGQGELSEIGKQAGKQMQLSELLQFVGPEFKAEDEHLRAEIENCKLDVRKGVQALLAAWGQEAQLHKLQTAKSSLEQRLAALQKTLPELPEHDRQLLTRYDALAALDGKRQIAERQAQSVMEGLTALWRTSRQPADVTSDLPDSIALQKIHTEFNAAFAGGIKSLGKELGIFRDKILEEGQKIISALDDAKSHRYKIMEKLTQHRSVTTQIGNLKEELQKLLTQIGEISAALIPTDEKFTALQTYIDALKRAVNLRTRKTKEWADKIETLSNRCIQAQLNPDRNWGEIFDAVDNLTAKTGSQEASRHQRVTEKLESDGAWQFLDALRADCFAALRWKQFSNQGNGDKPQCETLSYAIAATERILSNCIDLIDLQRVEAIATAAPKPDITLFYCDSDRRISFEKASEGQRAAALLLMLLEQPGGPLIVDQPEGDLDNKIVSLLAEKLHSAKQRRQIIFASHNANIVVNGSSELVAGMDVTVSAQRNISCAGAIDRTEICAKITETMEGGEKAFRDRKEKYGY